ncbi:GntR family transcriptional regulator [Amycolatopsis endophytica]|uniref:L-asparaginase II n=1 Tax=Amycolatopsis endophytica TaxID=860233 RepID=A0A853BE66_9PSEU|nr:hypothetical protein [Amycolatopsis endophytica]NYI93549.1 L-asparaginase II [Amycolatopsis endophytica]
MALRIVVDTDSGLAPWRQVRDQMNRLVTSGSPARREAAADAAGHPDTTLVLHSAAADFAALPSDLGANADTAAEAVRAAYRATHGSALERGTGHGGPAQGT